MHSKFAVSTVQNLFNWTQIRFSSFDFSCDRSRSSESTGPTEEAAKRLLETSGSLEAWNEDSKRPAKWFSIDNGTTESYNKRIFRREWSVAGSLNLCDLLHAKVGNLKKFRAVGFAFAELCFLFMTNQSQLLSASDKWFSYQTSERSCTVLRILTSLVHLKHYFHHFTPRIN